MSLNNALSQLNPSSWSQSERLLRLTTPYGADQLLVESFKGIEDLSQGFKLAITVLSTDAHISLKSLIGRAVLLELLTAHSRTELRPFHGHVTRMEALGANGGFARYRLQVEPWTAFMAHRIDSTTYQDMTVVELLESIFKDYQHQARGKLSPAWRFELADASAYAKRSLTSQYQESDLAFVQRLMNEEGLYSWIEHTGDASSPSLGSHTLVIADHNDAFTPNSQPDIDYARVSAVMKHDRLDRWRQHVSWVSNSISHSSWDYRQMNSRPVTAQVATDQDTSGRATSDQVTTDTTPDHHAEANQPNQAKPRPTLSLQETPGAYAYQTTDQGQRLADRQLEALIAHSNRYTGAGTVRTLSPGTTFTLHGHDTTGALDANGNANTLVITRVVHQAYNNLTADLQSQIAHHLGLQAQHLDHDGIDNNINADIHNPASHNSAINTSNPYDLEAANQQSERPLYRNRIDVILKRTPYRNRTVDEHSTPLYPKPTITGQQTAIVVGPAGQVIYTDRDYRIKVQFHWQRGLNNNHNSHSRLNHPQTEGHTGAPANEQSGTWVRLMTNLAPIAGANWGSHSVPRIGQEVLVDFTDGDIDRPIIIGSLYNGQGQTDAQHNNKGNASNIGSATGNAPSWFPGQQGAHAHPAVLSGIKTQGMATSQTGTGSYNQLVFDDTAGQSRTSLQQHSAANCAPETTDQANTSELNSSELNSSELNLGSLRHQTDNQRLNPTGYGTELHSHHSLAIRAGQGLLISTDAKPNASSTQLDSKEAQQQIAQAHQLQSTLANTAQQHNAKLQAEPVEANKLPAILAQAHSLAVISEMTSASGSTGNSGESSASTAQASQLQASQGQATAYSEPHLQLSSPAGIIASTPQDAILSAGNTSSITAGQDINLATQGNQHHLVQKGISLFTYGKVNPDSPDKPNTETGIKLHAASGKVSLQSQSAATHLNADQTVTIASISQSVNIAAPQHILMTAQGAYLKLSGGNIELHAPAKVEFKGSLKELAGPKSAGGSFSLPVPRELYIKPVEAPHSLRFASQGADDLLKWAGQPFKILDAKGQTVAQGTVTPTGRLPRVNHAQYEKLTLRLGDVNGAKLNAIASSKITGETLKQDTAELEQTIHTEDKHEISVLKNSRYYQEVAEAIAHHQSEFLPEYMLEELINKNSAKKA